MSDIAIVGSGGHAKVVFETLRHDVERYSKIVILDENGITDDYWRTEGLNLQLCPYTNPASCLTEYFHVAIGQNENREKVTAKMEKSRALEASVVHTGALISDSSSIGAGSFIGAGSIIAASAQLGRGCIVNHNAVVDHDCLIGDFCHVAPGAVVCGGVKLGCRVLFGAGAVVKQGIRIGNDCVVGAGSVVVKDVGAGSTVVGNPARKI